jgi:NAD(P)-dependent dehydrogenase (short-subunit alcohol dehydrogenase family)
MSGSERVAVISGASRGIGAATARRLARDGATVVVTGRDQRAFDEIVGSIRSRGGQALGLSLDVRDAAAIDSVVDTIRERYGRLDVVVSNAGIGARSAVDDRTTDPLPELLAVHVEALWAWCRAAVPLMRTQGGGAIVAVTSVHAFATLPMLGAYAASKTAILGLVRGLAVDHAAEGIRINAVAPGSVDTPMLWASARRRDPDHPERVIEGWAASHPIGRVVSADEVAATIAFLCSSDASAVTGVCIPVDGGLLARLAL